MIHDIVTNFSTLLKKKLVLNWRSSTIWKSFFLFFSIVFCVDRRKPIKVVSIAAKMHSVEISKFNLQFFLTKFGQVLYKSFFEWLHEIFFKWISEIFTVSHCGNSQNSLSRFFALTLTFFREINTAKILFSKNGKNWVKELQFSAIWRKIAQT